MNSNPGCASRYKIKLLLPLGTSTSGAKGAAPGAATGESVNCERDCSPQRPQPGQSPPASPINPQPYSPPWRPYRDYFFIQELN